MIVESKMVPSLETIAWYYILKDLAEDMIWEESNYSEEYKHLVTYFGKVSYFPLKFKYRISKYFCKGRLYEGNSLRILSDIFSNRYLVFYIESVFRK